MKTKQTFSALVLVMMVPLLGCNKAGKLAERSEWKAPAGPVELKLKWPQGERVEQQMTMTLKSTISVPGQPAPIQQEMGMGQDFGLTVLQANPDGTHEIEMDFLNAHMNMTMSGKKVVDYDSAKKSSGDKPDPTADIFGKIVGTKIDYFLDASNAIERIEGLDGMLQRLSSGGNAQSMAAIKSSFNEDYFRRLMSANQYLPPNAVQPGDTWPVHIEVPISMLGTIVLNFDFTFANWEMHGQRNCARLDYQGTVTYKKDGATSDSPMSVSVQDGTVSGSSWFDPELGIVIDNNLNMDMTMIIDMTQKTKKGPQSMIMTNQMNQVVSQKLLSVK